MPPTDATGQNETLDTPCGEPQRVLVIHETLARPVKGNVRNTLSSVEYILCHFYDAKIPCNADPTKANKALMDMYFFFFFINIIL